MNAQIISDVATANWAIAFAVGIASVMFFVIGVLLTRILNRVEGKLEIHETRITESEKDIAVLFDR